MATKKKSAKAAEKPAKVKKAPGQNKERPGAGGPAAADNLSHDTEEQKPCKIVLYDGE